jgi:hypothetical protein
MFAVWSLTEENLARCAAKSAGMLAVWSLRLKKAFARCAAKSARVNDERCNEAAKEKPLEGVRMPQWEISEKRLQKHVNGKEELIASIHSRSNTLSIDVVVQFYCSD